TCQIRCESLLKSYRSWWSSSSPVSLKSVNRLSVHLVSCRHSTSPSERSRKARTRTSRVRTELMFHVAIRIDDSLLKPADTPCTVGRSRPRAACPARPVLVQLQAAVPVVLGETQVVVQPAPGGVGLADLQVGLRGAVLRAPVQQHAPQVGGQPVAPELRQDLHRGVAQEGTPTLGGGDRSPGDRGQDPADADLRETQRPVNALTQQLQGTLGQWLATEVI